MRTLINRVIDFFLISCASILLKSIARSIRWQLIDTGGGNILPPTPVIVAFWHGKQLMMAHMPAIISKYEKWKWVVLISRHRDGRRVAALMRRFYIGSVAGSSSKGGVAALKQLSANLKKGKNVVLTPDGPRGPNKKSKMGIIKLAQLSGNQIYPLSFAVSKYIQFRSWDQMVLPLPFSKGACGFGEPITVPRECSENELEIFRELLDFRLNKLDQDLEKVIADD